MRFVPPVAERVAPGHEEDSASTGGGDLLVQVAHEWIGAAPPLSLGQREQPALLLKHDDVPVDLAQKLCQPVVLGSLVQAPPRRGVLDGKDRSRSRVAGRKIVDERRQ